MLTRPAGGRPRTRAAGSSRVTGRCAWHSPTHNIQPAACIMHQRLLLGFPSDGRVTASVLAICMRWRARAATRCLFCGGSNGVSLCRQVASTEARGGAGFSQHDGRCGLCLRSADAAQVTINRKDIGMAFHNPFHRGIFLEPLVVAGRQTLQPLASATRHSHSLPVSGVPSRSVPREAGGAVVAEQMRGDRVCFDGRCDGQV